MCKSKMIGAYEKGCQHVADSPFLYADHGYICVRFVG